MAKKSKNVTLTKDQQRAIIACCLDDSVADTEENIGASVFDSEEFQTDEVMDNQMAYRIAAEAFINALRESMLEQLENGTLLPQ